jgi:metal-responsive CopG/Arc/MetJ family transcriptional regulator
MAETKDRVAVRLPPHIREEVEAEADAERRTLSNMLRVLIEEALQARNQEREKQHPLAA